MNPLQQYSILNGLIMSRRVRNYPGSYHGSRGRASPLASAIASAVLSFPRSRVGAALVAYHMRDVTAQEELDKLEMIRLAQ